MALGTIITNGFDTPFDSTGLIATMEEEDAAVSATVRVLR
jgi:hypothetical protein